MWSGAGAISPVFTPAQPATMELIPKPEIKSIIPEDPVIPLGLLIPPGKSNAYSVYKYICQQ